jgi:N-acetyl-gamma-glutamylphosphate reductase
MIRASIIGGSGYAGGELLRLLLDHPQVQVVQVSSESSLGRYVYTVHANLRGRTRLKFCQAAQIEPCDVLFVALHHGETQRQIDRLAALAPTLVDLSADFRLRDPARYSQWYGEAHAAPAWTAEIVQELTLGGDEPAVHFSAPAIELVRGVLATGHVFLKDPALTERDLWKVYRAAYGDEPFVRIVKERQGIYRYPEPKILAGSNYCDVGFALDQDTGRVVTLSAIDNLVKGAAGSAVQCMNLMCGLEETAGLTFAGLHPI